MGPHSKAPSSPMQRASSYYNAAQASYFRGTFPSDPSPTFLEGRHLSLYLPVKQQACQWCNKNICVQTVPKDDLGYKVTPLQTREYDIYSCLDILHLVHSVFGQDAQKGPSVRKKESSLAQYIITKEKLQQQPEICRFLSFMKFHFTRWQHFNRSSVWRALEDIS